MIVRQIKVTMYQHSVPGTRRRRWFTRPQAYRSAAIAMVNNACRCSPAITWTDNPEPPDSCDYCSRVCDGKGRDRYGRRVRHDSREEDCSGDLTHSYRYRLVARLARWLRWRDSRSAADNASASHFAAQPEKSQSKTEQSQ